MPFAPITYICDYEQLPDNAWKYLLAIFAESGAKHLVLTVGMMKELLKNSRLMSTLQNDLKEAGLSFRDAHAIFGNIYELNHPFPELKNIRMMLFKLQINIAAEMGIDTITFHPGNDSHFPEIPLQTFEDSFKYSLDEILPEAEKCKVTICIENSWNYFSRPSALAYIAEQYSSPYLGLCFDSGHANVLSGKAKDNPENGAFPRWKVRGMTPQWEPNALQNMLPHIVNCHIHDNNAISDQHLPPGHGNIDWAQTASLLKKAPRLKTIQCEVPIPENKISLPELCSSFEKIFA